MPRMIRFPSVEAYVANNAYTTIPDGDYPVATEEELLEFANKLREAGQADVLEALIPSKPEDPTMCLLAQALNFSCLVNVTDEVVKAADPSNPEGFRYTWRMVLPPGTSFEVAERLSKAVGVPLTNDYLLGAYALAPLPAHIGNAADAFDLGLAFSDFVKDDE